MLIRRLSSNKVKYINLNILLLGLTVTWFSDFYGGFLFCHLHHICVHTMVIRRRKAVISNTIWKRLGRLGKPSWYFLECNYFHCFFLYLQISRGFFIHLLFINHQSQIALEDEQHLVFITCVILQSFPVNVFLRWHLKWTPVLDRQFPDYKYLYSGPLQFLGLYHFVKQFLALLFIFSDKFLSFFVSF